MCLSAVSRVIYENCIFNAYNWFELNPNWIFSESTSHRHSLTFLFVILLAVISSMMQMMRSRMMTADRRYQRMIAQCRMRMVLMMIEKPCCRGGRLMLGLHTLLYLALHLAQNRMMRWPACQMQREYRCTLEDPGGCQQGSTGGTGPAARRQREGQTTFQDHIWYQSAAVCLSVGERLGCQHQNHPGIWRPWSCHQARERNGLITRTLELCIRQR